MSVKRGLLIALIASAIILVLGGGSAFARLSELAAAAANGGPYQGVEIVISALDNEQHMPSVAYNWKHDEYLVVWHNTWPGNSDIYAQRVSGQGELKSWFAVGPTAPLPSYDNDRVAPSVAYDPVNDRYLVVWAYDTAGDDSNWDIHGVFVNWNGPILGQHQIDICDWPTIQVMPKVAYSRAEEEFMIVWLTAHPSVPAYISGRRMTASDGSFPSTPMSGSDFTIDHLTEVRVRPEIAYNLARNEYLVVYDNMQDVFGTRFTGTAFPLAGGEFSIASWSGAEIKPSVAACRETDQYLVAWRNHKPDIYARFIKGDGSLDGSPLHLENTSVAETEPHVACGSAGNQFLVVWQQQFSSATGPYGIWGQFVNSDKTLGEDFGILAPTTGITADFTLPAVAGGNVNYLTVWEHDRAGTAYQDIHGRFATTISPFYGVSLSSDQAKSAEPGQSVTYTLTVTNTGSLTDSFDLAVSNNNWAVDLSDTSATLGPGLSTTVMVVVDIPPNAASNVTDVVSVSATSQADTSKSATTLLTTTSIKSLHLYLPVILSSR